MSCHSELHEDETKKKKDNKKKKKRKRYWEKYVQRLCRGLRDVSADTTQIPMYRNLNTESTQTQELQRLC